MDIPENIKQKLVNLPVDKHPGSICIANYKGGVGIEFEIEILKNVNLLLHCVYFSY